jgi:23S rRNA (uracil1939-C5)-methyltransferase
MLHAGQTIALEVEKPAVGGRMIARLARQIVLVSGAIPGERVTARVERVGRGVAYAAALAIDEPVADRRELHSDPSCGGCLYAHITYPRQLEIKADVIADAFGRIGKITLADRVSVASSPEEGYRMRARLHRRDRQLGYFREGSHELCDVRQTRQLLAATCDALDRIGRIIDSMDLPTIREVEVSENIEASQRAVHLGRVAPSDISRLAAADWGGEISGVTVDGATIAGDGRVRDVLVLDRHAVRLGRHPSTFFQGNRYLLARLVTHVVSRIARGDTVIDLYAGAGLFAISAAAVHGSRVIAVEGDETAARDLAENVRAFEGDVRAMRLPIEQFTTRGTPDVLIVDPPRTGMTLEALQAATRLRSPKIVYVSCDVATLARDARRLMDAGYEIQGIEGFDMFPNTPHIETIVEFKREF